MKAAGKLLSQETGLGYVSIHTVHEGMLLCPALIEAPPTKPRLLNTCSSPHPPPVCASSQMVLRSVSAAVMCRWDQQSRSASVGMYSLSCKRTLLMVPRAQLG